VTVDVGKYGKAIQGLLIPPLTALLAVLVGPEHIDQLTTAQWITVVLAGLGTGGAVYAVTNSDPEKPVDQPVAPVHAAMPYVAPAPAPVEPAV